jgi:radical SAM superfamily enzyme YgiQ (UPF0313 family)
LKRSTGKDSGKKRTKMLDLCLAFTPAYELQDDRLEPPLGLLYLATTARKAGFDVSICDLAGIGKDLWALPEARYYGFVTYSTTYARTLELVGLARRANPEAIMIAGGPHASALPEEVAEDFDHVVVGEGELAICELLMGIANEKIISGHPVSALDKLPYLDYSLVDMDSYHRIVDGKKSFTILSSRGCPHGCLFCNSIIMGGHKPVRFRSPSFVVGEMMGIQKRYGDVAFRFGDDIFGSRRSWLEEFSMEVKCLDNLVYRAFVRLNQCAEDGFTDLLAASGCKHIAVGLESGSDTILSAMRKGITKRIARGGIRRAKESGLIVRVYLIVGFPGETWDTVNETIELVREVKPDEFVVYPLIPYPGTPIYNNPECYGLRNIDKDFSHYFQICGDKESQFVYDLANADRHELQAMKDHMVDELEKMQLSWARDSKGYI